MQVTSQRTLTDGAMVAILIKLTTHLHVDFFEKLHLHLVSLVLGAPDTFEVELCLLHLDDGLLDVRQTDGQDDVFWSLGPDTARGRHSEEIFVRETLK